MLICGLVGWLLWLYAWLYNLLFARNTGGTFIFRGLGGPDVGAFTSTITLSNPLLAFTNPTYPVIHRNVPDAADWTLQTEVSLLTGRWEAQAVSTFCSREG